MFPKTIGIHHTRANYLVYEQGKERTVSRVIFYEPEQKDKALTLAPTLDRHLIIGATESDSDDQPTSAQKEHPHSVRGNLPPSHS